jgi:hypothetical protein
MKKHVTAVALISLGLTGCLGNSSAGNEAVGQVKRVQHKTPILCPDYNHVDISLGVMRNGVGSMSTQDMWLYVPNALDNSVLTDAAQSGALVKISYDVARGRWFGCVETATVTAVTVLK